MAPDRGLIDRFRADLDALVPSNARLGIALSGGQDSIALLLLAAASRPGLVEAATVDHGLRPEGASEAVFAADICRRVGVPHAVLTLESEPKGNVQAWARRQRYEELNYWCHTRAIPYLLTAHHVDDQAETFLMRLVRGSGVRGLAGVRRVAEMPTEDRDAELVRPLLGWRREELAAIVRDAGIEPVSDPSNVDDRFDRARMRKNLAAAPWLDPEMIARSASNLADADDALDWATWLEWRARVRTRAHVDRNEIRYRPRTVPKEIQLRLLERIIAFVGYEGEPRRSEVLRLLDTLKEGGTATLAGVKCTGGRRWLFETAPPRSPRAG